MVAAHGPWRAGVRVGLLMLAVLLGGSLAHGGAGSEAVVDGGVSGWPALPERSGTVVIPAQEWPLRPGPRGIAVHVRYPGGAAGGPGTVRASTGLMLSLHNWGGTGFVGTADPGFLADTYDVVAIGVDYLQSGRKASIEDPEPYDFGWLQALDALRALHFVWDGLTRRGVAFDRSRVYATGGSGGGNVCLMANKLAPRTFAVVVDISGMKKLTDDIAFGLPGGSELNARYVRDAGHPFHLSEDARAIRDPAEPVHLALMKRWGCEARILTVHGVDDGVCPGADEFAAAMRAGGLDFTHVRVTADRVDGEVFTGTGHSLGDRTRILAHVAGRYLDPGSPRMVRRRGATDFERREVLRYPTAGGQWVVRYDAGYPEGEWEAGGVAGGGLTEGGTRAR